MTTETQQKRQERQRFAQCALLNSELDVVTDEHGRGFKAIAHIHLLRNPEYDVDEIKDEEVHTSTPLGIGYRFQVWPDGSSSFGFDDHPALSEQAQSILSSFLCCLAGQNLDLAHPSIQAAIDEVVQSLDVYGTASMEGS